MINHPNRNKISQFDGGPGADRFQRRRGDILAAVAKITSREAAYDFVSGNVREIFACPSLEAGPAWLRAAVEAIEKCSWDRHGGAMEMATAGGNAAYEWFGQDDWSRDEEFTARYAKANADALARMQGKS